MKKIDTTQGSDPNAQQPFIAPSLKFVQDAAQEAMATIARRSLGISSDGSTVHVLYGCENSGSGSNYIISSGAVFYQGEVYEVSAATFTAGGGQTAVATITTTNPSPDPILFKDGSSHNVHNVRKVTIASAVSGTGIADFGNFSYDSWTAVTMTSGMFSGNGTPTFTSGAYSYKKVGKTMTIIFNLQFTSGTNTNAWSFTIPGGYLNYGFEIWNSCILKIAGTYESSMMYILNSSDQLSFNRVPVANLPNSTACDIRGEITIITDK